MNKAIPTLILMGFLGAVGALESWSSHYDISGIVSSSTPDTAVLTDSRGYEWNVYTNCKVMVGTKIIIHFFDNKTPDNIQDDVVRDITIIKEEC